jgi:hypothetical protein
VFHTRVLILGLAKRKAGSVERDGKRAHPRWYTTRVGEHGKRIYGPVFWRHWRTLTDSATLSLDTRERCPMSRILVTGISGTGKSSVLGELGRRGYRVVDTDDQGWRDA